MSEGIDGSSKKISSLRFNHAVYAAATDTVHFAGFMNAVLEYLFRMSRELRGDIDCVVYMSAHETEKGVLDRCARVHAKRDGKCYFYYVVATTSLSALQEWKVIGRSYAIPGSIRTPDYEKEMIWFE